MSTWNMPSGVTTNDIPGNDSNEDALQAAYVEQWGQHGVASIADVWLEHLAMIDGQSQTGEVRKEALKARLMIVLQAHLSDMEAAEEASRLCDGPTFQDWCDQQEDGDDE